MDGIIFLILIIGGAVLIMPIIALVSATKARGRSEELGAEISSLREREARLIQRIEALEALDKLTPAQETPVAAVAAPETIAMPASAQPAEAVFAASRATPPPIPQSEPAVAKPLTPPPPARPAG